MKGKSFVSFLAYIAIAFIAIASILLVVALGNLYEGNSLMNVDE